MKNLNTSLFIILLCIGICIHSIAQVHQCGMSHSDIEANAERIKKNRKTVLADDRTVTTNYVPVAFHLVANSNGVGRAAEGRVLDALCMLNLKFLDAIDPIQFYIHDAGFNYVDNSFIYDQDENFNEAVDQMNAQKIDDALNVFVVFSSGVNANSYYLPSAGVNDFVVVDNGVLSTEFGLTHPVGHFFSLIHPFRGWESNPWNEVQWGGVPVDSLCPDGITPTENQSGSNCMIAGDLICDTPPDYLFGLWEDDCMFDGNAIDFEGNEVMPMENNIMSAFYNCLDYVFTQDQKITMVNDLLTPERDYINPGITPIMSNIDSGPELLSPASGEDVDSSEVTFVWTAVPGATHYLLEVDRLPSYSFSPRRVVTTDTTALVQNLGEDLNYYWQVRPFNQYITCGAISGQGTFETFPILVSANELDDELSMKVYPNPLATSEQLFLDFENDISVEGTIEVYSMAGEKVYAERALLEKGSTIVEINTKAWASGIYYLSFKTVRGVLYEKIVVQSKDN